MESLILLFICIFIMICIFIVFIIRDKKKNKNISLNWLSAIGTVMKTEANYYSERRYYVHTIKYIDNDKNIHESKVNLEVGLPIGSGVIIKFNPNNYNDIVFISEKYN